MLFDFTVPRFFSVLCHRCQNISAQCIYKSQKYYSLFSYGNDFIGHGVVRHVLVRRFFSGVSPSSRLVLQVAYLCAEERNHDGHLQSTLKTKRLNHVLDRMILDRVILETKQAVNVKHV
jgi:hypothetical protein